jgi:hypothetical protein
LGKALIPKGNLPMPKGKIILPEGKTGDYMGKVVVTS